jgi:phage N-6-adenine-methyltransferase
MGDFDTKFTGKFKTRFDSKKQDWETPDDLYKKLDEEFHFTFDLAASPHNTKCEKFCSIGSLHHPWKGVCWLNPPYGNTKGNRLSDWVKKAHEETKDSDTTVVMLIPARTNTNWWHLYCMRAYEIKFINGRPKFGDADHGLPQPLAIVVFKLCDGPLRVSSFNLKELT